MSILNIFKRNKKSETDAPINGQDIMGQEWVYSDEVKKHFFEPQNFTAQTP